MGKTVDALPQVQRFANGLTFIPVTLKKVGPVKGREVFREKGQNENARRQPTRTREIVINRLFFAHWKKLVFLPQTIHGQKIFYYGQMVNGQKYCQFVCKPLYVINRSPQSQMLGKPPFSDISLLELNPLATVTCFVRCATLAIWAQPVYLVPNCHLVLY